MFTGHFVLGIYLLILTYSLYQDVQLQLMAGQLDRLANQTRKIKRTPAKENFINNEPLHFIKVYVRSCVSKS